MSLQVGALAPFVSWKNGTDAAQHHSGPGLPDSSRATPPRVYEPEKPWPAREPSPDRTGFMLDRFTETSPVIYATNDLIVNSLSVRPSPNLEICFRLMPRPVAEPTILLDHQAVRQRPRQVANRLCETVDACAVQRRQDGWALLCHLQCPKSTSPLLSG